MHDPRVGRFFAVDPLTSQYPHYTPYSTFDNNPVLYTDPSGADVPTEFTRWERIKNWIGGDGYKNKGIL